MAADREIIIRPAAISAPQTVRIAQGLTVAQIVDRSIGGHGLGAVAVEINGIPVAADRWASLVPAESDHVLVYTTMGQGFGDNPLRAILSIVVIAAASYFGGPVAGSFATKGTLAYSVGSAVATATIATAGMMLVNAIAPIRGLQSQSGRQTYNDSLAYSIGGGSNTAKPFGVVPHNLGRNLVYPDVLGSYTELDGNDEYLRMLFCWGWGQQKIEDIKIGDTLMSGYEGIEIETYEGLADDPDISLYPSIVSQVAVGVDLLHADAWITRTLPAGYDEISWDIEFPRGLMEINSYGNRQSISVVLGMQYRESGGSWVSLSGTVDYIAQSVSVGFANTAGAHSILADPNGTIYAAQGTGAYSGWKKLGEFTIERIDAVNIEGNDYHTYEITSVNDLAPAGVTGLNCTLSAGTINVSAGSATYDIITITDKTATVLRRGFRAKVDRTAAHEIRISRTTQDRDSDQIVDTCRWTYLRGITNDAPVSFPHPLALTAIRIKASGQINGTINSLNGICTSYAETWNGTGWGGSMPTQNQAALARLVLMGPANFKARTTSQMDEDAFGDWYELCETQGYQFNMVRDFKASAWDAFADIAATARAAPTLSEGKWSVIMDVDGKTVKNHITPRNSWGFSAQKQLYEMPHAFRVKFKNEAADFDWDEVIVYDDGYTSANATLFETIEFPGITNANLAWKFGRFQIAQARLRPEEYFVFQDFEHLAATRGALVRCAHDVSEWGLGSARVKSLATSGANTTGVVLDETVAMEAGTDYVCRFRKIDGTSLVVSVVTAAGETATLTLSVAVPTVSGPAVGDLTMFGEADSESAELLVKRIERQNDFVARLTLVDLASGIYDADTGAIPDFDSQVTAPIDITKIAPGTPSIINIESGTIALEKVGSTVRPRILASCRAGTGTVRIGSFTVRYRILGNTVWSYTTCQIDDPTAVITDVVERETYELAVRATSIYGAVSRWSSAYAETVLGSYESPSDVDNFRIEIIGATAYLSWDAVTDLDLAGYKIKYSSETSGAVWSTAYTIAELIPSTSVSTAMPARQGTYLIKAIDLGQRESDSASSVINAYGDILDMNVVETLTEDSDFSGTHDRTTVVTGVLQLSELSGVMELDDTGSGIELDDIDSGIELDEAQAGVSLSEGYYYFDNDLDLGDIYTSRVSAAIVAGGIDLLEDLFARTDFFEVDDFFGAGSTDWNVISQVRTTDDDPAVTPTWTAWKEFGVSDLTGRAYEFRVKLLSYAAGISPGVTELSVTIDMPDRHIAGSDLTCTVAGLRVTFTPAFYGFKGVGVALQDMDTGDYALVQNKDETGFDINFYDSTDTAIERTFDYVAAGYGRKVT